MEDETPNSIKFLRRIVFLGNAGLIIITLILVGSLSLLRDSFTSTYNLYVVARTFSLAVIIGFSQLIVLIVGQFNLSVGAIGSLAGVTAGFFLVDMGSSVWVAIAMGLLVGSIAGLLNGLIIVKTGINAFITTLGTASLFVGLTTGFTKGYPYNDIPDSFTVLGKGEIFSFPYLFFIMIAIALLLYVLLWHFPIGRKILATGGNEIASRLSGIKVDRIVLLVHSLSGLLAAVAGVLYVARVGSAQPTIGEGWLLQSFAIPIIGGTSLTGGVTSIFGALLGGFLITLINNGLVMLNVSMYWQEFYLGLLILVAVGVDKFRTQYVQEKLGQ